MRNTDAIIIEELSSNVICNLIIGSFIFITILAWCDIVRVWFSDGSVEDRKRDLKNRFYLSLTLTAITVALGMLIHAICVSMERRSQSFN
ncbi:MAG: DUF5654 family protein [Patescibacteria group bacterium]